ncbi:MAG: Gldg family protein, partial [Gemmatimonadales bacterium]
LKRDVDDLLRDLRSAGRGQIRVVERDPSTDEAAGRDAQSLGIQPVQFNVIGKSELQVKQGYLGLAIQHGGKTETIPFVQRSDDLEYRLVSTIRQLSRDKKPVVGLLSAARSAGLTFGELQDQLSRSYEVRSIELTDSTQPAADVVGLVLAGVPDSLAPPQLDRLRRYVERGGGILVLAGGMEVSPRAPIAQPRPVAWNPLLERFGLSIRSDMAYDLVANEIIPLPTDFGRVLQAYPFFIRSQSTRLLPINQELQAVVLSWASTIDTAKAAKGTVTPLLVSSQASGVFSGPASIAPSQDFPQTGLEHRLLGAVARTDSGRAVVVGSADFASDRFVRSAPENLAFVLNAIDWLAQDEALIAIRSKDRRPPPLVFSSDTKREGVKYANLIGLPLLVGTAGALRLVRRHRRSREPYRPLAAQERAA